MGLAERGVPSCRSGSVAWRFSAVLGLAIWVALVGPFAAPAGAVPIGEQIVNGEFGSDAAPSLAGWTVSGGTSVNARASTSAINTIATSTGFDSHFSSAFAVLGDDTGAIAENPFFGTDSISQSFVLPATQGGQLVVSYDLSIDFETTFDGIDTAPGGIDIFSASLILPDGTVMSLVSESSATPMTQRDNDLSDFPVHVDCAILTCAGTYTLRFELFEANVTPGTTNTAAGIDGVSVTANASSPPSVPEPSTLLLVGAGLLAAVALSRLRKDVGGQP
jgi:hypothetical protein